jgi:hypothetical protein
VITVLLDNDITGSRDSLEGSVRSLGWEEYQLVRFITLKDAGLVENSTDREIWLCCQQQGMILLTANRNKHDDTSLEQTMRDENTEESLPVLTVGDKERLREKDYRERCVNSLITIIFDLDQYLGTGRQYIP